MHSPHFIRSASGAVRVALLIALALAPVVTGQTLATVPGQVMDLSVDSAGRLLFCTEEGVVGRIALDGVVSILADTSDGLPTELRAVLETPLGDVAVAHSSGDIFALPGGSAPPTQVYSDLYMVLGVTDMVVDADGNFLLCSKTPSLNTYGINWISSDGNRWAYYLVEHAPYGLAHDPVTGGLFMSDRGGQGALRLVDTGDETHPATALATATNFDFQTLEGDGDVAIDVAGNAYIAGGGTVFRYDRGSGMTSTFASGFAQLRGLAISASSGNLPSATGWSLYLASGDTPSQVLEIGGVEAPAGLVPPNLGTVPDRGLLATLFIGTGLRVYDLAVDNDGNLLAGGDQYGANQQVRRIQTSDFSWNVIAGPGDGIQGRVEGITVAADGTITALTRSGYLHRIDESQGPLVTTLFTDPTGQVVAGKDLALDRDGALFIADREGYGPGEILEFSGGSATTLYRSSDTRGLAANPFTAGLLATVWNCVGYCGTTYNYDFGSGLFTQLPGLTSLNFTNDWVWGDGAMTVDVEGNIYTCSEDDWRVTRYDPVKERFAIIGSSYRHHPSGLAIAPSSPGAGSTSGWSLFVSEFDFLWEIPSVPPPAPSLLDRAAPPIGENLGWFQRSLGEPLAMLADPAGDGLYVTTEGGHLVRLQVSTGAQTTVYSEPSGSPLTAITALSNGDLVVAETSGLLYRLDVSLGLTASVLWANGGGELSAVHALSADGLDRVLVIDGIPGFPASRVQRLSGGQLSLLTHTQVGLAAAFDPLTGDAFIPERGRPSDGLGEVLRVNTFASPATHGHWFGSDPIGGFEGFAQRSEAGGIAFDASGNFYVTESGLGRVAFVDRASGVRSIAAGNYAAPRAVVLAPGTPGVAGPSGTSLFVLDSWAVFEVGVAGVPAGNPPNAPVGLAPPAEFQATGSIALSSLVPLRIQSPSNAGRLYLILASLSGKVPGFPLFALGAPDPRVLPSNPDVLWNLLGVSSSMPGSIGLLDGAGTSPPGTGIVIGPSPTIFNVGEFLDIVWLAIDPGSLNRVAHVGGTAQLYLGQ